VTGRKTASQDEHLLGFQSPARDGPELFKLMENRRVVEYTGWSVYVRRPISHVQCRAHRYVLVHGVVVLGSRLGGAMALLGKMTMKTRECPQFPDRRAEGEALKVPVGIRMWLGWTLERERVYREGGI
jgi:hypothetical protein